MLKVSMLSGLMAGLALGCGGSNGSTSATSSATGTNATSTASTSGSGSTSGAGATTSGAGATSGTSGSYSQYNTLTGTFQAPTDDITASFSGAMQGSAEPASGLFGLSANGSFVPNTSNPVTIDVTSSSGLSSSNVKIGLSLSGDGSGGLTTGTFLCDGGTGASAELVFAVTGGSVLDGDTYSAIGGFEGASCFIDISSLTQVATVGVGTVIYASHGSLGGTLIGGQSGTATATVAATW